MDDIRWLFDPDAGGATGVALPQIFCNKLCIFTASLFNDAEISQSF